MGEVKPTPGPWEAERIDGSNCFDIKCECGFFIATCHDGVRSESNAEANARLIAEAGTVFHNTGLTPRQLVERVKELEGAAKVALEWFDAGASHSQTDFYKRLDLCADAEKFLRAALSKALPNADAKEVGR